MTLAPPPPTITVKLQYNHSEMGFFLLPGCRSIIREVPTNDCS